jgi:hypothetical protein
MARGSPRTPSGREAKKTRRARPIDPESEQGRAIKRRLEQGLPPVQPKKKGGRA